MVDVIPRKDDASRRSAAGESGAPDSIREMARRTGIVFWPTIIDKITFHETLALPIPYMKRMEMVPVQKENGTLTVALTDPWKLAMADEMAEVAGCTKTVSVLTTKEEILSAIQLLYDRDTERAERVVQDLGEIDAENAVFQSELEDIKDLMDSDHDAPIVRFVNVIIPQALQRQASDIHIEPYQTSIRVRFRIDGVLYEIFSLPRRFHAHLVSRFKVMASLDIAEKRVPQDGRMKIRVGSKAADIRISVIPMNFGERVVLRILDKNASRIDLEDMGMSGQTHRDFERLIQRNSGILLVTGPTGSGKTTTLYGALSKINTDEKNIITIEDPIEYELPNVGQIQVNPKSDLTFSRGLRSVLRHDPDIIMVGEFRDRETVEIAVQASLTGHLVFSPLHTNDAAGALTRLVDMGVEPYLIGSSLIAVMAQRLVRVICPNCRAPETPESEMLKSYGLDPGYAYYRGAGCEHCMQTGYRSRTGIFELLIVEEETRTLLKNRSDAASIKASAVQKGMSTLFADGIQKVVAGITTLDEILRVTQA